MLPHILPMIPRHRIYLEAFAGGASVFWAKKPSQVEVLNDQVRKAAKCTPRDAGMISIQQLTKIYIEV